MTWKDEIRKFEVPEYAKLLMDTQATILRVMDGFAKQIDDVLNPNGSGVFSQHYVGNNSQVEYPTPEKSRLIFQFYSLLTVRPLTIHL